MDKLAPPDQFFAAFQLPRTDVNSAVLVEQRVPEVQRGQGPANQHPP